MFIADRNVYGIDLNPVAVELAEVSLWLNTIYGGRLCALVWHPAGKRKLLDRRKAAGVSY